MDALIRDARVALSSISLLLFTLAFSPALHAVEEELPVLTLETSGEMFTDEITPIFKQHCAECHDGDEPEGDLNLSQLEFDMKTSTSAARWAMVLDKVVAGEMPPEGQPALKQDEVKAISTWIQAEMKRAGKHLARREAYINGNSVPHYLLFGGKPTAAFDAASGVRRISPPIYNRFTGDLGKGVNGIGQPLSPESSSTFADMGAPKIDEPVTVGLMRNALLIVGKQTRTGEKDGKPRWIGTREFEPLFDKKTKPTDEQIETAVRRQFETVIRRQPTEDELQRFVALYHKNVKDAGQEIGTRYTLAAVFMLPEAVFRFEVGDGQADDEGRVRLTSREIAFALAYALTDKAPDGRLLDAAKKGQFDTQEGVAEVVQQMLDDPKLQKPRILRFFQEYFDYVKAPEVFKDPKQYNHYDARTMVDDTDRLIEHILEEDKDVLKELLTTNKAFVSYRNAAETKEKRANALKEFNEKKKKDPEKYEGKMPPMPGRSTYLPYSLKDFPDKQPTELPKQERAGILTQPAWLMAYSTSDDNNAILRGKWMRERLLGNVVPDIPITVDAQLPNAPEMTLRQRMHVTEEKYCWQCHKLMNDVGLPFEIYDHVGRYREVELVLDIEATEKNVDEKGNHQGDVLRDVKVNASGKIDLVGVDSVKSDVRDAVDMLHKLAESEYVEQVFVRHAFRYWAGRNESLGDAKSLQASHRAYRESGGSMEALIVALLSSDSFLFRVPSGEIARAEKTD